MDESGMSDGSAASVVASIEAITTDAIKAAHALGEAKFHMDEIARTIGKEPGGRTRNAACLRALKLADASMAESIKALMGCTKRTRAVRNEGPQF